MASKPIIGILTGGGDVPGLNSVIKSVVYRADELGYQVLGIRRGWMGLTHMRRDMKGHDPEYILPLDRANTRTIDRTGGTMLHTSRTNPKKIKLKALPEHFKGKIGSLKSVGEEVFDLTDQVLENLQSLKIQYLVAIGGDDTLSYAAVLDQRRFPVIAIPKTMDNDVQNTEYCIGFATAISRASEAIERQRTTMGSHERIGIFRVFGRDAGFTALYTAYVTAVRCLIPEHPFDLAKLMTMLIEDKHANPSRYALVIISEGAIWKGQKVQEYGPADAYGHRKKMSVGEALSDEVKRLTDEETMVSDLTYDLRSGHPDFVDRLIATTFANIAMDQIRDGEKGRMTALQDGKYVCTDIPDPAKGPRKVDVQAMYNTDRFRPIYSNKLGLPLFLVRS
jgi:ATP-dependent phosphofructokinase / diphosphate-dependent phosphofructokinase